MIIARGEVFDEALKPIQFFGFTVGSGTGILTPGALPGAIQPGPELLTGVPRRKPAKLPDKEAV
jgi:hypothetical protein